MDKRIYYLDTLRAYVPAESNACRFGFDVLYTTAPVIFFLSPYFGLKFCPFRHHWFSESNVRGKRRDMPHRWPIPYIFSTIRSYRTRCMFSGPCRPERAEIFPDADLNR